MRHGIADHAINARAAPRLIRAVELGQLLERRLPGRGRRRDGGVSQGATRAQGEDSRGHPHFTHRHDYAVAPAARKVEHARAISYLPAMSGNLDRIMRRASEFARHTVQVFWSPTKIVIREQNAGRAKIALELSLRPARQRLNFNIAPLAARADGRQKDVALGGKRAAE